MMRRTAAFIGALGLFAASALPATANSVALVIRDLDAQTADRIVSRKSVDDIADSLWAHGLEVIYAAPAGSGRDKIIEIMQKDFVSKISSADVALLYYVGAATTGRGSSFVLTGNNASSGAARAGASMAVQDLLNSMSKSQRSVAIFDIVKRTVRRTSSRDWPASGRVPATS